MDIITVCPREERERNWRISAIFGPVTSVTRSWTVDKVQKMTPSTGWNWWAKVELSMWRQKCQFRAHVLRNDLPNIWGTNVLHHIFRSLGSVVKYLNKMIERSYVMVLLIFLLQMNFKNFKSRLVLDIGKDQVHIQWPHWSILHHSASSYHKLLDI